MFDARRLDAVARAQHGVISSAQAVDLLGRQRKERWGRDGLLTRVQPSVWRLPGAPVSWYQQLMAAQLTTKGRVSHRSTGEIWGLLRPRGLVEVSVRTPRQPVVWAPAILHRIVDLDDAHVVEREGLRMTDPVRTLVDLGLVVDASSVERAYHRGIQSGLFGLDEVFRLRQELSRSGRNGVGIVGELIERQVREAAGTESPLESRLLHLLRDAGLELPLVQHEIWHDGRFVARVDAAYPRARLVIELDGYRWHSGPTAFQRDRTRQNQLVGLGWIVLRFTWDDLDRRPQEVVGVIAGALARSSQRGSVCA